MLRVYVVWEGSLNQYHCIEVYFIQRNKARGGPRSLMFFGNISLMRVYMFAHFVGLCVAA